MISKKERTRESILDTAYELFARDGFNKITMKDICEASGMSRGGLYSHFGSTRELFEAILEKINQKDEMNFQKEMEDRMNYFNRIGEKKWSDLIEYGIVRGEFNTVNVKEIVHVILYAYQGVRMWSRIVSMTPEVYDSITNHIRKQLIKEQ